MRWSRSRLRCRIFPGRAATLPTRWRPATTCWVLRLGGDVAGFSVFLSIVDEAHLLDIGVDRRHQRQGHGGRLLQQVSEAARAGGAVRMLLEVRPANTQAIAFYRGFGFAQIGVRRGYYPAAAGREDALVLGMELR
jgi:ribosomal-protein-alanine N-acetyltransferase